MFTENISAIFSDIYIYSVLGISAIILILITADIIRFKIRILTERTDIERLENQILMHQGCNIENLPLIGDIFDDAPRYISACYSNMIQVSKDLYQKKWIPNPKDFISLSTVLDNKTYRKLTSIRHRYYILLGFLIFIAVNVSGVFLAETTEDFFAVIIFSSVPFFAAFIPALISGTENKKSQKNLSLALESLNRSLSLKLPVFSENNGMSILINQFLEYDRNMSDSVSALTDKIDRFVLRDLAESVSSSIEKTLLESVAPSIERSTNAIITLSEDITKRETEGMKDLAVNFTSALTSEMTYQFEPMVEKFQEVSNTLSNSKNYLDIVSQTLESYKENLNNLHELTYSNLKEYEETKKAFSEDMHTLSESVKKFSNINAEHENKMHEDIAKLEKTVDTLNNNSIESSKNLRTLLDGIFVEARNSEEQAIKSQESAERYLQSMNTQIDKMTSGLAEQNSELINKLSVTIKEFFDNNTSEARSQQTMLAERFEELLKSIEESAAAMGKSSEQLKKGFDELEKARILMEENSKKSFFGRKKKRVDE